MVKQNHKAFAGESMTRRFRIAPHPDVCSFRRRGKTRQAVIPMRPCSAFPRAAEVDRRDAG
jgi:hypothetical protein